MRSLMGCPGGHGAGMATTIQAPQALQACSILRTETPLPHNSCAPCRACRSSSRTCWAPAGATGCPSTGPCPALTGATWASLVSARSGTPLRRGGLAQQQDGGEPSPGPPRACAAPIPSGYPVPQAQPALLSIQTFTLLSLCDLLSHRLRLQPGRLPGCPCRQEHHQHPQRQGPG